MRLLLLLLIAHIVIPQAWAGSSTPPAKAAPAAVVKGDFSLMKNTSGGRVDKIIDAQTILLKDGKIIRLLGIDYPYDPNGDIPSETIAAKAALEKILPESTEVSLWQSRNVKTGRVNRMGHLLAHLETKKDGRWINGTLLDDGFAWVITDWNNPDMASQLLALEDKARQKQKGIWAKDSAYGLLNPDTAKTGNGTFRVVEGVVARAASAKNNLYLNFGNDTKSDFTVMISPTLRKSFSKKGIEAMGLQGKTVRVRGWLREWNGPFMELESTERLEILSPLPSTGLSADLPTEIPTKSVPEQTRQLNP